MNYNILYNPAPGTLTSHQTRIWYLKAERSIISPEGLSLEEQAKYCFN